MRFDHPIGLVAVLLAIISFYGTAYVVIALNVGWRFGYWLSSATFGALMVLMSIFWVVTALGPQGSLARWVPVASAETVSQVTVEDRSLSAPSSYPGGGWQQAEPGEQRAEDLKSAVNSCLSTDPETLEAAEGEVCAAAQSLMPPEEDIPIIDGVEVAVLPELSDIRFTEDGGATLGQMTVVPLTRDPRVADDPEVGLRMGDEFRFVAALDQGSLRLPSIVSLVIWLLYAAFHLYGLHRAETRKLSPVA